jgi:hypothetical protein
VWWQRPFQAGGRTCPGRFRIKDSNTTEIGPSVGWGPNGQGRYIWGHVLTGGRRGIVAGLVPRVCKTFVERAGRRRLALLIAGEGAVAPARIIIALQAEWVSGRNLRMCTCRALDGDENK